MTGMSIAACAWVLDRVRGVMGVTAADQQTGESPMKELTVLIDDEQPAIAEAAAAVNASLMAVQERLDALEAGGALAGVVAALESRIAVLESRSAAVADILDGDAE